MKHEDCIIKLIKTTVKSFVSSGRFLSMNYYFMSHELTFAGIDHVTIRCAIEQYHAVTLNCCLKYRSRARHASLHIHLPTKLSYKCQS